MIGRLGLLLLALLVGIAAASLIPPLSQSVRHAVGQASPSRAGSTASKDDPGGVGREKADAKNAGVKISNEQMVAAGITLAKVAPGTLTRRIIAAGTIILDADRVARVSVKLSATVAELRKKIGDAVARNELLAVLESREVADAKSEYLAARLSDELQQDLFARDKALWERAVSSEQQFIRSRNQTAQTRMRLDIARQKLIALGAGEREIAALPKQPEASLRRQDVRSPIAGRVAERKVDLGTAVGRDNLETELFVIVDLDRVWVELAVSPGDLPAIKEGQAVTVSARAIAEQANGKVIFISPMLDKETRAARVVAEIANSDGAWRPGSFVTGSIAVEERPAALTVPTAAVQTIDNQKVVFVRTEDGFEKRPVRLGESDNQQVEVRSGVAAEETVAVANTFLIKSELLKTAVED